MESKLTLKLDTGAIGRAKKYVAGHCGSSLSKLVENYFNSLTKEQNHIESTNLPPIVSGLAGIAKKNRVDDTRGAYTDYLTGKYR